ncbi:MAG TPA: PDZ domain-containing protein [Thermoanaerobaculia bacterium]|nr:PDZ domain-containing protein [Thermoanaerobaculia bacterium]
MNARFRRLPQVLAGMALAVLTAALPAWAQPAPPTVTVRPPMLLGGVTASRTHVVFSWAGDLWSVEREGGEARRLTDLPGDEDGPWFSPDDAWIAFNRDTGGGADLYVMPAQGGEARRLTWHPKEERIRGWTRDGKAVLFAANREVDGVWRLYTMAMDGVAMEALPFPEASQGALSPDGSRIAYVPFGFSWDGWRHYRGGMTSPIRIARLADSKVEKIDALARPDANNRFPMWVGDTLWFVSDRTGVANLFSYDLLSGRVEQHTRFPQHGIRVASAAPDAIVFVADGRIHLFDLAKREDRTVDVRLTAPAPELAKRTVPAARFLETAALTPTGDLIVSARGEVLSFDPKTGQGQNLTRTSGVAERSAAASPDGRSIAWFSDASGEYELHVAPAGGTGEVRRIAVEERPSFYREPTWSPDGRRIAFSDKRLSLWVADLESGQARKIATSSHIGQGLWHPSWSPDGRWLAYAQALPNRIRTVFLYDTADGRSHPVTDGQVQADLPAFDRSGRYLYLTTSANARTAADDLDWGVMSSVLARPLVTGRLNVAVLRKGDPAPLLPNLGQPHPAANWEPAGAVEVDLDGIGRRIVPVSPEDRDMEDLAAGKPGVLFALVNEWPPTPGAGGRPKRVLYRYTLGKSAQPEKIAEGVADFRLSGDGASLLYGTDGQTLTLMPADAPAGAETKPLDLAGLTIEVDPGEEWKQMHRETWRLARDWFYDPGHHGQNLPALETYSGGYLPGIIRRADLNELFGRMLAYLSVSHLDVGGGDIPPPAGKPERIGLLGADFRVDQGRYRITRILRSAHPNAGHPLLRAPLDQPGVDVREGDYLLAADGEEIRADRDVYSYFAGKAGKPVEIKVAAGPDGRESRTAIVVPLPGDHTLRRFDWAERNRLKVSELSGGRIAYAYIPGHGGPGYDEMLRGVLGNLGAEGIVIDQRFSPGGVVFDSVIDLLRRRPLYAYTWREGDDLPMPTNAPVGAKVLITNRQNGSAAETFALMWKLAGVGPIVGTRTGGGGIGGALFTPDLLDGGGLTIPNRAAFSPDGTWGIENDGVYPDIDVDLDPESWRAGRDPQLEAAVKAALAEIPKTKKWEPKKPAYPKYP